MARRRVGTVLVVLANLLLLYTSVAAYARAHSHLDRAFLAQYASPWPVALCGCLALGGIMLALVPIRRGERWSVLTALVIALVLFATRISTDPRCLVVLDPHQHGCHTFMIAILVGVAGLALAWR